MPPKKQSAHEPVKLPTWKELATTRTLPSKVVDFPAYDEQGNPLTRVALRILSHKDHIDIQLAAEKETRERFKDEKIDPQSETYQNTFGNIAAKHFLHRVCRDAENLTYPFFPTPDEVGKLSNDEVAKLHQDYYNLKNAHPYISTATAQELELFIEKLATDTEHSEDFLSRMLPEVQIRLLMYLAAELWTCRKAKSTPTLSQSA